MSSLARGLHILSQPPQHLSGQGVWAWALLGWAWGLPSSTHTVNFLRKTPRPPLGTSFYFFLFFLAEWYRDSSKASRLKTAVWSMVITSGVLNLAMGRGVEGAMRWVGQRAELRQTPNLFPVMAWHPSSLIHLCVRCCQHAGSAPCPNACLETSCWSHFSPEESLISTNSMRSV